MVLNCTVIHIWTLWSVTAPDINHLVCDVLQKKMLKPKHVPQTYLWALIDWLKESCDVTSTSLLSETWSRSKWPATCNCKSMYWSCMVHAWERIELKTTRFTIQFFKKIMSTSGWISPSQFYVPNISGKSFLETVPTDRSCNVWLLAFCLATAKNASRAESQVSCATIPHWYMGADNLSSPGAQKHYSSLSPLWCNVHVTFRNFQHLLLVP